MHKFYLCKLKFNKEEKYTILDVSRIVNCGRLIVKLAQVVTLPCLLALLQCKFRFLPMQSRKPPLEAQSCKGLAVLLSVVSALLSI